MDNGQFCGLVKFFKNEEYLEDLLNGVFYLNTPEFYRHNNEAGVGDLHESCSHAYREKRGDCKPTFTVNGKPIEGLINFTMRNTGMKDRWLHCWSILTQPNDEEALAKLVCDFTRLREEFGLNYAYIHPAKLGTFIDHLKGLVPMDVNTVQVNYCDNPLQWSPVGKSEKYSYQREFRFMVGTCPELSQEPKIFRSEGGFREFILKNPSFRIYDNEENWIYFQMSGENQLVHNKHHDFSD